MSTLLRTTLLAALLTPAFLASTPHQAHADKRPKSATPTSAPKTPITVHRTRNGSVKVDGFVTDWGHIKPKDIRSLTRGQPEYDWTGPRDLSILVQAQYDETHLYLAIEVRDNIVTSPKGRKPGDSVEVWIDGGPLAGRNRLRMLRLKPGKMADGGPPEASWGFGTGLRGTPKGLLLDGSIRNTGYFFEVGIPLDQVSSPPPGLEPFSAAFIARDWDYDDPNEDEASVSSAPFDAKRKRNLDTLAPFIFDGVKTLKESFYIHIPEARGTGSIGQQFVDIGGDARREWVFLAGNRWLVMAGLGLGDGQYYYYNLEHGPGITYRSMEVRDLTGDQKAEFIVRYVVPRKGKTMTVYQEYLAVYRFTGDGVRMVLLQEIGNYRLNTWEVTNTIEYKTNRKTRTTDILITKPTAKNIDRDTYIDVDNGSTVNWTRMLLPWEEQKTIRHVWSNGRFLPK